MLLSQQKQAWSSRVALADIPGWTSTIFPAQSPPILRNLCRYEGAHQPLVLRLDSEAGSLARVDAYARRKVGYFAGGQDLTETYYDYQPNVACYVELGFGAAQQSLFFDWQPGVYQLPSCEFASVQALFYGPVFASTTGFLGASIAPGHANPGKMPTRTQRHRVAASDSNTLQMSIYTRALEVLAESGDSWTLTGNGVYVKRDLATPSIIPSVSPVPFMPDTRENTPQVTLLNNLASQQDVTIVEYLDFQ